ncbi:LPS export ABC transporter permease LptG [Thiomicrorhabdus sp.]|uniref:LPS export ABC transporter permease LptG n=1 Tax=Thiomicrorhabdus sp. TaxID=2039724 RepID=UPI0029C99528|nr:LPS export ABC transporter permease LptG [Thiomicrorhabdus sp.]
MNRIERYLGQTVLLHTFLVMLVLLVILSFFEFMNQLGKLSDGYTLSKGVLYTLLKVPVYGYEIFPIALLIGTLMGLGGLANRSELTVLRVTGWSVKRILGAVLKTALLMWLVIASLGEWIAPESEAYAVKMRAEALNKNIAVGSEQGFWVRQDNEYIHIGQVLSQNELRDLTFYRLEGNQIREFEKVDSARYREGSWLFYDSSRSELRWELPLLEGFPAQLSLRDTLTDQVQGHLPLAPEDFVKLDLETRYLGIWDLYQYIAFLKGNGLDAGDYELAFWKKVSMPLVVIAMIAIVFPLIFGSLRQVSMGQRIFFGVLIGMGFHLLNQLLGNLSVVYHWPVILGALSPAAVLLLIAILWMQRIR